MKKNAFWGQWLVVTGIGLCLALTLVFFYRSPIVQLFQQPAINAFVNGVPAEDTARLGVGFMPHLQQQVRRASAQTTDSIFKTHLTEWSKSKNTGASIYGLLEQCNISYLAVAAQNERVAVYVTISAPKPFSVRYFFSIKNGQTTADSVSGIDHLLLYLSGCY